MHSPAEIAKNYVSVGESKCKLSVLKLLLLGFFAGMFIALAGAASATAGFYVNKFAGAFIFSAGLAMVIIAGSELFTGNCLIIISVLEKRVSVLKMLKNWLFVYIGNFIGALLVACFAAYSGVLDGIDEATVSTAAAKANIGFGDGIMKGVLCNVLVCIGVWMAFAADTAGGKILTVILPITAFVLCGYEHSIANMYFIPAGLMQQARLGIEAEGLNIIGFIKNLVPVTIGNIIGGSGIVGFGYWLAYRAGKEKSST